MLFTDVLKKAITGNAIYHGAITVTAGPLGPVGIGVNYTRGIDPTSDVDADAVASGLTDKFDDIGYYNQI